MLVGYKRRMEMVYAGSGQALIEEVADHSLLLAG